MAPITGQGAGAAAEGTATTDDAPLPLMVVDEPADGPRPPPRVAYWGLKREDCARLFPSGRSHSQAFRLAGDDGLAGVMFTLSACCGMDRRGESRCFGLFLEMQREAEQTWEGPLEPAPGAVTVEYEFAARTRASGDEFVRQYEGYYNFSGGKAIGYRNLFSVPWPAFVADDSAFFVDGALHLRAALAVKQP